MFIIIIIITDNVHMHAYNVDDIKSGRAFLT